MLAAVAVFLVRETRGLLIGESAASETIEDIQSIAASDPAGAAVWRTLTMQLAPDEVLLNIDLAFRRGGADDARAVDRIERSIRGKHPESRESSSRRNRWLLRSTPVAAKPQRKAPAAEPSFRRQRVEVRR